MKKRIMRDHGGKTDHVMIRRLKCPHCQRLHNELPNILVPRKHYKAEVIENIVDEAVTTDDDIAEDFPCEATICRWKDWVRRNHTFIDGMLNALGISINGEGLMQGSLLEKLRGYGSGWLSFCLRPIYNSGGFVPK